MNPVVFIAAKRDGGAHTAGEIAAWIEAYVAGRIGDEQMAAWAMAVYLNGMTPEETAALTAAMIDSGSRLQRGVSTRPRVDKHSTGGVGDKVSILLAPLLACSGLDVPMLSGRGLGATGGTLDKLESIRGFRTDLDAAEIDRVLSEVGCVITGTTLDMVPADRKLYALRDVTGTVSSIPLITASILSKKMAEDLDALVFDVKCGGGSFMQTPERARALADSLVAVGRTYGVATSALLTDMDQPLGRMIGHANEIDESVAALEGRGPQDLIEVTLALGAELLVATGVAADEAAARGLLQDEIDSGAGRETLARMVAAQGGDLEAPRPLAAVSEVAAAEAGWVVAIDAKALGLAAIDLGGGRKRQGDRIDHSVGLEILVRRGDQVESGQPLMRVFGERELLAELDLAQTVQIAADAPPPRPLILI
ncbi:MAG: thymidine phosphorylase [Acidobacteria bacterium]|nr:thymidine phosphorylase [Acidobacteriota bacterium]